MSQLMDYVRVLTEDIGPRPATTDAEHRAAEWLATTFGERGLETEVQEFFSPRTYSWAYVIYHVMSLTAAFFSGFRGYLAWPSLAVAALAAFFMWGDLDTRWGLSHIMPKGPSQNVVARHVPRARRGERLRKIVIVAHYDSARASLAFSPGMVGGFPTTFGLMKWITISIPVLVLMNALPFLDVLDPWIWYLTIGVSAYLLVPLVINIHRELFMPFVEGANDNASGVAAMLGVMEQLVPAPDALSLSLTGKHPVVRHGRQAAEDAGVVPEGAELTYSPAATQEPTQLPDDFKWAEPVEPARGQAVLDFDTIEFGQVGEPEGRTSERRTPVDHAPERRDDRDDAADRPSRREEERPAHEEADYPTKADEPAENSGRPRRGLFSGLRRKQAQGRRHEDMKDWLGVDEDFDARNAGRNIGSWDNFGGEDGDDDTGWKGGWAGDDPIGDPEFAASEAARIRRRVTETVDRELTEKEVWFVATGAEEVGTYGMQALLREYGEDLKDALIVNIDGCGAGQLFWASAEGMARRYRADRRLVAMARKVSRDTGTVIKPRVYKGLSTDTTPALVRGYKAMSIMAFDANGLPVNWHWKTDTADSLDPELIQKTSDFVLAMVREA